MSTTRHPAPRSSETSVQEAIRQTRPFRSLNQEALIALLLTTEAVKWPIQDMLADRHGLTLQQYNVLRILRGAGRTGLPTLEIAERMVERTPGVTRMIDRLEKKGLVSRERSVADRRQVFCRLTEEGRKVLRSLDAPTNALDDQVMAALRPAELKTLIRLLNRVRNSLT